MNNTALVTAPNSDLTTRYLSAWAKRTIEELKLKQLRFILLEKSRVVLSVWESMIKKNKPSLIFLNGHGGHDSVCGQNNEILVRVGKNEEVLKGTITYALACSSAKVLGPKAVQAGAIAYVGYDDDFIFFISPEKASRPLEDKTTEMFLAPANHFVVSLAKGHTVSEAFNATRAYFYKSIQKLISSETSVNGREYVRYLIWDMKSLVCHGDRDMVAVIR